MKMMPVRKTDKKTQGHDKKTAKGAKLWLFLRGKRLVLEECPFPSHTPNAETRRALEDKRPGTRMTLEEFRKYLASL
jgi:hypothetical protein